MSKITQYKPSEVYDAIKEIIEANDAIMSTGGMPVALSIIGERGIGKSTVEKELVHDLGRQFVKVSLAQMTEPSELIGYYVKEFEMVKGEETKWVFENLLTFEIAKGYMATGTARTTPCPPSWVVGIADNAIIVLDDYSRGNSLFSQAIMELVNSQEMIGWDLRGKNVQILLNENPDDGNYNVSSQDSAQTDRMAKLHMRWDAQDWACRAEKLGMDERLINFVLYMPELLESKKEGNIIASNSVSPRMMDKFFSLVSTIPNFSKNLDKIARFGDATVGKDVASKLIDFINKDLDKLPSVHALIMESSLEKGLKDLALVCGDCEKDAENWKPATASILSARMYNYMRFNHEKIVKDNIRKYAELMLCPAFSIDQKFMMVKQTIGLSNQFQTVLAPDPRFLKLMA